MDIWVNDHFWGAFFPPITASDILRHPGGHKLIPRGFYNGHISFSVLHALLFGPGWMEKVEGSPPTTSYMSPDGNFYFSFSEVRYRFLTSYHLV